MKKFILIFYLIFPLIILSQELDQAYLESLPDDIRKDVLGELNQQAEDDKPEYRRPTTMVERQKALSERLAEVKRILDNLSTDFDESNLEIDLDKKTIKRFGSSIFNLMQSSFMPINEPNFDGSYILDFGDELELQLIGQEASTERLLIERDGSVNIEDIGKIFLSGLSLDDASELIRAKVEQTFIGVKSFISLTNVRDIQIIVIGDVYNPGVYTLNGNSTIFAPILF